MEMRDLRDIMDSLPAERRAQIESKTAEMIEEIENLRALRLHNERTQQQIAESLRISQPSVSKIERQFDLYLSTLRRFVEAAGGTLELRVQFPGKPPLRLSGLGELSEAASTK
jgi:transcriptional regulator with XRE-family HTH domain